MKYKFSEWLMIIKWWQETQKGPFDREQFARYELAHINSNWDIGFTDVEPWFNVNN